MDIKTKFSVTDRVYFMNRNNIHSGVIGEFTVNVKKEFNIIYYVDFVEDGKTIYNKGFNEIFLFANKEELLASL